MSPAQSTGYSQAGEDETAAREASTLLDEPLEAAAWRAVAETLRERLAGHTFRTYVASSRVLATRPGALKLGYPTRFLIDMVRDHYRAIFEEELLRAANRRIIVEFDVLPDVSAPVHAPVAKPSSAKKHDSKGRGHVDPVGPGEPSPSRRTTSGIDSKYNFDSFVTGQSNQFAHAACRAVAEAPGKVYNPLFLWGGVGLGKTHLMQAVGNKVLADHHKAHVLYVTSEHFTNDVVDAIRNKRMGEFRKRYRECDVLLIDDVQFLAGKPATEEEFFHTFNALHSQGKQIIVSSDSSPREIDHMEERLRSRFQWGLIADVQAPELETRIAILKTKAEAMRLRLPDDVANYLATHIRKNVRELEGSLTRIIAFANLMRSPISVAVCKDVLKTLIPANASQADVERIIKRCAEFFQVTVNDIKGPVRKRQLARARQAAMYLARKLTSLSYPELGERFGGKDHTTVLSAVQRVPELMAEDEEYRINIESLQRELGHSA